MEREELKIDKGEERESEDKGEKVKERKNQI